VQEYVDHFSHLADFVGEARIGEVVSDLAAAIRMKVEKNQALIKQEKI